MGKSEYFRKRRSGYKYAKEKIDPKRAHEWAEFQAESLRYFKRRFKDAEEQREAERNEMAKLDEEGIRIKSPNRRPNVRRRDEQ